MGKYYLTKKKLNEVREEYENIKEVRKNKLQIETPSVLHSEELNIEFVSFQEDLDILDSKIEKLEEVLNNFETIKPPPKKERDKVNIGAQVQVEARGNKDEFTIVGTLEADPNLGKISNESPVGKVLLGCKAGDEVVVFFPVKEIYKIKKIKYKF